MSIYLYWYYYLANVSFLDCQEQANVSVKCGYILKEKSSISYTVMHLAYIFSLTSMTVEHTCGCHQKDRFCLFYYIQIHISQFCKFWIKIQGNHLTQLVWHNRIIFCFFSYIDIFHLLQRRGGVGICCNQLQPGFPWLSRVSNGLKYYLLFQIPTLESGFVVGLE